MPSVLGLVIMNTATLLVELRAPDRPDRRSPLGVLLTVTVSKPAIAALAGFVPWALSGASTLRALLADVAKIGRRHQQRRQFAVRPGGRLQRNGRQAGDLGQHLLQVEQQFQHALAASPRADRDADRAMPGSAASRSFRLGLYFIVHEPSG